MVVGTVLLHQLPATFHVLLTLPVQVNEVPLMDFCTTLLVELQPPEATTLLNHVVVVNGMDVKLDAVCPEAVAKPADAEVVLTEKDAVKLDPARLDGLRVWVLALDFAVDAAFEAELLALLPPPRPHPPT